MNAAAVMVSATGLEQYLHQAIPLSRAMQVSVVEVTDEQAILSAPLGPNINHLSTVFGGSACALATLSAWSLLHCRLQSHLPAVSLVLQSSSMHYLHPISGAFSAHAQLAPEASWELFLRTLQRRGRARIAVQSRLLTGELEAGLFSGEFVALAQSAPRSITRAE